MTWYAWVVIAVLVINPLLAIAIIGKPRKPLTSGNAIFGLIGNALIIWAILALAGVA